MDVTYVIRDDPRGLVIFNFLVKLECHCVLDEGLRGVARFEGSVRLREAHFQVCEGFVEPLYFIAIVFKSIMDAAALDNHCFFAVVDWNV